MLWSSFFGRKKGKRSTDPAEPGCPKTKGGDISRSLCAVISETDKETNQDACGSFYDEMTGTTVLAVADGIGSNRHVAAGSRFVVDKVLERVETDLHEGKPLDFTVIFADVQRGLTEMVDREYAEETGTIGRKDFGTTLIVGVDTPRRSLLLM